MVHHHFKSIVAGFAAAALALSAAGANAQPTSVPANVLSGAYVLDASHGKITWSVSHLGFSIYIGQFTGVAAKLKIDPKAPAETTLDATVDTNSVGTLSAELDTHLKSADFLDTGKFPNASFHATKVTLTGDKTADVAGDLTLHGVTKPVVLKATFLQAGPNPLSKSYELGFAGAAVIKRSDFGMTKFVPMIGDDVTLTFEAEFHAAPAS